MLGNQSSPKMQSSCRRQQLFLQICMYFTDTQCVSVHREEHLTLSRCLFLPDWFLTLQPCDSWDTTELCLLDIFHFDADLYFQASWRQMIYNEFQSTENLYEQIECFTKYGKRIQLLDEPLN